MRLRACRYHRPGWPPRSHPPAGKWEQLGVAVAGTVVATSHAKGLDFTRATHPIWWIMTGCGAIVLLLGWAANTPWAHASTGRVAHLFGD